MTRRNFAAVVAVPVGAFALPVVQAAQPAMAQAPARAPRKLRDPVLTQLHDDIHGLIAEAKGNAGTRKQSMRAIEALLMVTATHFAQHYDAGLTALIQRKIRDSGGKDALISRALQSVPNPPYTTDQYRRGLDLLDRGSVGAWLREAAIDARKVRVSLPDQAAYRPVIYMSCTDLQRTVADLEYLAGIIGVGALIEPGPFFEAGLVAVGVVWAFYATAERIYCR